MQNSTESGAITIAETLIALAIGMIALTIWAQGRLNELEINSAKAAGQAIAAYSRAASSWLANNPPAKNGSFDISNLQQCDDDNGSRYLSCSYNTQTPIKFAFGSDGKRLKFGDVEIDVVVAKSGASGTIDFGVFRSGSDRNSDGLPDSRPDLAAIALESASETTGAGVLSFFEIGFARESPDGVIFDEDDSAFNQSAIDDLARLQATIGANVKDVPFLRVDGTNEMTGEIKFDNGMQVAMNGTGLSFEGPGNVEVQTTTGTLVVSDKLQTSSLESDSAEIDSLTVDPKDGVKGSGFDRLDQSDDITRIDGEILGLTTRVTANEKSISDHTAEINRLDGEVEDNSELIDSNNESITDNNTNITDNTRRIAALESTDSSPNHPLCTPSKQEKIGKLSQSGYPYYNDSHTNTRNCNAGVSCRAVDRCGDTVNGRISFSIAWGKNPVSYSGRDPSTLKCATYSMNFYRRCGCVVPDPSGCR